MVGEVGVMEDIWISPTDFAEMVGKPLESYAHQCHAASIALVQSGLLPGPDDWRVARGSCRYVPGQHSWVVLGDVYKPRLIIDPTLWSYRDQEPNVLVCGRALGWHVPHGSGTLIWSGDWPTGNGPIITLDESALSLTARSFLAEIGPMDAQGWARLASGPVEKGWPAKEIIEAMLDDTRLRAFVPIDTQGHLTDRNPGGVYLRVKPQPDLLGALGDAVDQEREDRRGKPHSHEKWQLRQDPEGRTYCAACGVQVP
jgi:hypothetical protein